MEKLQLSDLSHGVDYPMSCEQDADRCRIHVKMTEISMKSVEGLIHSDKGAFFSLWFEESGGKISIPVGGRDRVFQLKMAPGGGQSRRGILECVHQELSDQDHHQLKCLGPLEHRLTVQGTDDSYVQTKKKMEQAEIERNKNKAQEIKIISKGQSKSKKILQTTERSLSPAIRRPNRPVQPRPPPPSSSSSNLKHSNKSSSGGGTGSPRPSHSLKERVIHLLALKPQKRSDLVSRLKKETKRSETNMSKLDDILSDVGELVQGAYKLRASYTSSVQIKEWPFYSDLERQMLKRKLVSDQTVSEAVPAAPAAAAKRPLPTSTAASSIDLEPASKKAKLVNPPDRSILIPTPPPPTLQTGQTRFTNEQHSSSTSLTTTQSNSHIHAQSVPPTHNSDSKMNGSVSTNEKEAESNASHQPPLTSEVKGHNSMRKKEKKKKKKQKHKEAGPTNTVVTSDPTSTTNIPDYASQFPPIMTEEQRTLYKKEFGEEYEVYNSLKEHIETVSPECAALSKKLDSLPKHSKEAKEVRQQIRKKYRELQPFKSQFDELHHKLDHIKKMVVAYDTAMYPT